MNIDDDLIATRLDSLLALTPLPAWRHAHEWRLIESDLGIALPTEYKAYADRFPSGTHRGLLIFHPDDPRAGLTEQVATYAHAFAGFEIGRTFYPQPGGLIPWAAFESETCLFWQSAGEDPDLWPVVACSSTGNYEALPGSTLEALAAVLRGDAGRTAFHESLYDDPLEFWPLDPEISLDLGLISPQDFPSSRR